MPGFAKLLCELLHWAWVTQLLVLTAAASHRLANKQKFYQ